MTSIKNKKVDLKRVNMNLPANLVQKVVDFGESLGLNTTSAYIVLLNQALEYKDVINTLPIFVEAFKNELSKTTESEED